jgi:hypothetical protein
MDLWRLSVKTLGRSSTVQCQRAIRANPVNRVTHAPSSGGRRRGWRQRALQLREPSPRVAARRAGHVQHNVY